MESRGEREGRKVEGLEEVKTLTFTSAFLLSKVLAAAMTSTGGEKKMVRAET